MCEWGEGERREGREREEMVGEGGEEGVYNKKMWNWQVPGKRYVYTVVLQALERSTLSEGCKYITNNNKKDAS